MHGGTAAVAARESVRAAARVAAACSAACSNAHCRQWQHARIQYVLGIREVMASLVKCVKWLNFRDFSITGNIFFYRYQQ